MSGAWVCPNCGSRELTADRMCRVCGAQVFGDEGGGRSAVGIFFGIILLLAALVFGALGACFGVVAGSSLPSGAEALPLVASALVLLLLALGSLLGALRLFRRR
ncbi:MAG: hypothetical protein IT204_17570 [Fimbriimonadaceae bacterium]|nr:hypothetical protein [Fimbriimonadaceae bacterium]